MTGGPFVPEYPSTLMRTSTLLAAALLSTLWTSLPASAQTDATGEPSLWRASGGEVDGRAKRGNRLSGSIGVSFSQGGRAGLFGPSRGLDATLGGAVIEDRLWFFGAAQLQQSPRLAPLVAAQPAGSTAFDAKAIAQLGEGQSLQSSFSRQNGLFTGAGVLRPESLFSLHYTAILSSNMFVTASATRSGPGVP